MAKKWRSRFSTPSVGSEKETPSPPANLHDGMEGATSGSEVKLDVGPKEAAPSPKLSPDELAEEVTSVPQANLKDISEEEAPAVYPEDLAPGQAPKVVRGRPFQPGNPGRPAGAKNHTTRLLEEIVVADGEKLIQKLVEVGLKGNVKSLHFCADRLLPRRKGRPVDFALPPIKTVEDVPAAIAAILTGVNEGRLTTDEANDLAQMVEKFERSLIANDLAARIEALELQAKKERP